MRLSSSKNEGGRVRLCQNSVAFTLPTTVAPVKRTLATTVALGSFSTAFKALCSWGVQLVRGHSSVFTDEIISSADLYLRSLPGWPLPSPHLLCM